MELKPSQLGADLGADDTSQSAAQPDRCLLSGVAQTSRFKSRQDPGGALQADSAELAVSGLASMYPAFDWSVWCSRPSWMSARVRSR
jgi:hypothetical protein